jgi:hypothetical protein
VALVSATLADADPTALAGVALIQSEVVHPLFGVVGLVLLFVLGSLEFVGPFEPQGWKLAGIGLLLTA